MQLILNQANFLLFFVGTFFLESLELMMNIKKKFIKSGNIWRNYIKLQINYNLMALAITSWKLKISFCVEKRNIKNS